MRSRSRSRTLVLRDDGRRLVEMSALETLSPSVPPVRALVEKVATRSSGAWFPTPPSLGLFHLIATLEYDPLSRMRVLARADGDWKEVRAEVSLAELSRHFPGPSQTLEFELGATFVADGVVPDRRQAASGDGENPGWLFGEDPTARARMKVIEEACLPLGFVFERGPSGPGVRLEENRSFFTRNMMRFYRSRPSAPRFLTDPPMDVTVAEELVRLRVISSAYTHGEDRPASGTIRATRLIRSLHDAITGQASRTVTTQNDGGRAAEERLDSWHAAWQSSWRPQLPVVIRAMATILPELVRLYWTGRGLYLERHLLSKTTPVGLPSVGASASPRAWLSCSLLGDEAAPVLDLVRSSPGCGVETPPTEQQTESQVDIAFLHELARAGGPLAATSELYGGIQIKQIGANLLRAVIQIPEHLAGTGLHNPQHSRLYAHWPATELGFQFAPAAEVPASGKLGTFQYWDERIDHHPLCSSSAGHLSIRGGTVCIADSGDHAGVQAIEQGFTPGQVAAAQLLELRDTFMLGIRSGNRNNYYRNGYAGIAQGEDSGTCRVEFLAEDAARAMAQERKISINEY